MPDWIDVTTLIKSGMVHWPGDPAIEIERTLDMDRGDPCNVSRYSMGAHTGTHMDGPLHFLKGGKGLDQMPLDAVIGPARVIEIRDKTAIRLKELRLHRIRKNERVLFKTRNSTRSWKSDQFDEDFVYIAQEAARFLAERGVRTVGVDYLSVGGYKRDGVETHEALLGAGIWIIEGLNLGRIEPGPYDMICLPLKVQHSDGAPARALLKPRRPRAKQAR